MTEELPPRVVSFPSDDEMKIAFEIYATAVGKVAHAWNFLHERLGRLFVMVIDTDRSVALAIWYSTGSDRVKQYMLKEAILAAPATRWAKHPKARDDLDWLMDRVIHLAENRNNAIHAPCILLTDHEGTSMAASYVSGHDRAQKLRGKEILVEFDWCERWSEELSRFTERAESALIPGTYPWPERPSKPDRRPKSDLGLPRPPGTI